MRLSIFSKNCLRKLKLSYLNPPKLIAWLIPNIPITFLYQVSGYRPYFLAWKIKLLIVSPLTNKSFTFFLKSYDPYFSLYYYYLPYNKSFLNKNFLSNTNLTGVIYFLKNLSRVSYSFYYLFIYLCNTFLNSYNYTLYTSNLFIISKSLNTRLKNIRLL